ncbi:MAG: LysM peptidoglycan-binding domain-containing protein [Bacillales bacterium]|nr:LysM peptidoglycan-binding domain-containing protein [Bacillales bacterium]
MIKWMWKNYRFAIILVIISVLSGYFIIGQMTKEPNYQKIVVHEGDSLWSIAVKYGNHHNMDYNEFVKWVEQKNHLASPIIKPGDKIIIPVKAVNKKHQVAYKGE